MKRKLFGALGVIGVILLVAVVRVVMSSRAELSHGDAALARSDLEAARVHYRRSARWYAPGNPYSTDALDRLASMAREAEQRQDPDTALSCWRAIRAAILSTRSSYVPHAQRLDRANQRIAALMAAQPPPPIDAGRPPEELEAEHLALLQSADYPSVLWTLVLLLGFLAWIIGAFLFATRAIDTEDRFVRPQALRYGAMIALGFAAFAAGLVLV